MASLLISSGAIAHAPSKWVLQTKAKLEQSIRERVRKDKLALPAHFFVLMAYEGTGNIASDSHTFASFIKVDRSLKQTWSTISWLPQTFRENGHICVFENLTNAIKYEFFGKPCAPVAGTNYTLSETLRFAQRGQSAISQLGIFHIQEDFYLHGLNRKRELESGKYLYLADDRDTRSSELAINCIHAVSDLAGTKAPQGGIFGTGYKIWGNRGSRQALKHLARYQSYWFYDQVTP